VEKEKEKEKRKQEGIRNHTHRPETMQSAVGREAAWKPSIWPEPECPMGGEERLEPECPRRSPVKLDVVHELTSF